MVSRYLKTKLLLFWMILLLVPVLAAGGTPEQSAAGDSTADSTAVYERRIDLTVEGLSHAVDLWHDANMLENADLIARYEILIDNILRADIRATEMVIKTLEADCKADRTAGEPTVKAELEDSYRVLYEKEKLADQVRKARTFTEKYRYLGGYINSLRRELGMPRLRLADDKEALEDSQGNP